MMKTTKMMMRKMRILTKKSERISKLLKTKMTIGRNTDLFISLSFHS